ncbi:unnamed protein product [Moneuplotes crassus]|uniref:Uncharacterized protein n=1 Tax=Euplotes crassus TaxID=5936 RepID=A0AAD2DB06_EUPCR|nr:unnamed protein product [Moneuplotes crassus]
MRDCNGSFSQTGSLIIIKLLNANIRIVKILTMNIVLLRKMKGSVADLRQNLLNKRTYSIFVGDKSYKTNFWLRFIDQGLDVNKKFKNSMLKTHRYSICCLLFFILIGLLMTYFFTVQISILALTALATTCLCTLHISKRCTLPKTQRILSFLLLIQMSLFLQANDRLKVFIILLANMTIDLLNGYQWYSHLLLNLFLLHNQLIEALPYIAVEVIVYSLLELAFKKAWVLQDTAKRSEKLFHNCFDKFPYEVFIVDKKSNLLFYNEFGEKSFQKLFDNNFKNAAEIVPKSRTLDILNLVSDNDRDRFRKVIEAVADQKDDKICQCQLSSDSKAPSKKERRESSIKLSKEPSVIPGVEKEYKNDHYCPKCNTKYNVFQFISSETNKDDMEKGFELVQVDFIKMFWKSIKSVMIVAKSLKQETNSHRILESQTKEVESLICELNDKIESNHKIETKLDKDTSYSTKMLKLSNTLYNKFSIIKNFFHIENNTLEIENNLFDLKSAIYYTIDLCSMAMQNKARISINMEELLPNEVRGDKIKLQQILSCIMDLVLMMTSSGEIILKSTLDRMLVKSRQYLIKFSFEFTPTSLNSNEILSSLFSKTSDIKKLQKNKFLSNTNVLNASSIQKIPHLQIGLVRNVIYKLIYYMQGNYKTFTRNDLVIFEIKLPLNHSQQNVLSSEGYDDLVSPLRLHRKNVSSNMLSIAEIFRGGNNPRATSKPSHIKDRSRTDKDLRQEMKFSGKRIKLPSFSSPKEEKKNPSSIRRNSTRHKGEESKKISPVKRDRDVSNKNYRFEVETPKVQAYSKHREDTCHNVFNFMNTAKKKQNNTIMDRIPLEKCESNSSLNLDSHSQVSGNFGNNSFEPSKENDLKPFSKKSLNSKRKGSLQEKSSKMKLCQRRRSRFEKRNTRNGDLSHHEESSDYSKEENFIRDSGNSEFSSIPKCHDSIKKGSLKNGSIKKIGNTRMKRKHKNTTQKYVLPRSQNTHGILQINQNIHQVAMIPNRSKYFQQIRGKKTQGATGGYKPHRENTQKNLLLNNNMNLLLLNNKSTVKDGGEIEPSDSNNASHLYSPMEGTSNKKIKSSFSISSEARKEDIRFQRSGEGSKYQEEVNESINSQFDSKRPRVPRPISPNLQSSKDNYLNREELSLLMRESSKNSLNFSSKLVSHDNFLKPGNDSKDYNYDRLKVPARAYLDPLGGLANIKEIKSEVSQNPNAEAEEEKQNLSRIPPDEEMCDIDQSIIIENSEDLGIKLKEFKTNISKEFSSWFVPLRAPRNNRAQKYRSEELKEQNPPIEISDEDRSVEPYNGEYPNLIVNHISDHKFSNEQRSLSQDGSKPIENLQKNEEILYKSYSPILFEKNGLCSSDMEIFLKENNRNCIISDKSQKADSNRVESDRVVSPSNFFSSLVINNQLYARSNNLRNHPNQEMSLHLAYNEENFGDQGEEFNFDEKVQYNKDIGFNKFREAHNQTMKEINPQTKYIDPARRSFGFKNYVQGNNFVSNNNFVNNQREFTQNNQYERSNFAGSPNTNQGRFRPYRARSKIKRAPSQEAAFADFYKRSEQTLAMQKILWEEDEEDVVHDYITLINP